MQTINNLPTLKVSKVFVVGIAKWLHEYSSLVDAIACVYQLEKMVKQEGAKLDFIEVRVEFETGESERCCFKEKERVFAWLKRFQNDANDHPIASD